MKLTTFRLLLGHEKLSPADVPRLRGYFANEFPHFIELHHHINDDKFLYSYPVVQYKTIGNVPTIIGIGSGVDILKKIYDNINQLKIANQIIPITEKQMIQSDNDFGLANDLQFYQFLTPWLGLNQNNYHQYQHANLIEKMELLQRILVGNLLSMSKAFQYTVPDRIYVAADTRLRLTHLKGTELSGFLGYFATNFNIPDYLGIGKSVSRGFGTIKKITLDELAKKMKY